MNKYVKLFVRYYTTVGRKYLEKAFKLMEKYYPVISQILKKHNLPVAFVLLPIITSYYKRQVKFVSNAAGIWQLMPITGKMHGLMINKYVDERFDIVKSTTVACKYLNGLKKSFKSYELVIAAYNGKSNYIRKKMRKHKSDNFWDIVRKGGFEKTFEYVPKFYALLEIVSNAKKYDFKEFNFKNKKFFETVYVRGGLNIKVLAKILSLNFFELQNLNYQLKENLTLRLRKGKKYAIRVPVNFSKIFYKKKHLLKPYLIKTRVYYVKNRIRVKKGDTLGKIAKRYRVSTRGIIRLNRLKKPNVLRIGRVLRLPRKRKVVKKYRVVNPLFKGTKTYKRLIARKRARKRAILKRKRRRKARLRRRKIARLKRLRRKRRLKRRKLLRSIRRKMKKKKVILYKVKKGDTVSELAVKFSIPAKKIIRANRGTTKLIIGRVIKIKRY